MLLNAKLLKVFLSKSILKELANCKSKLSFILAEIQIFLLVKKFENKGLLMKRLLKLLLFNTVEILFECKLDFQSHRRSLAKVVFWCKFAIKISSQFADKCENKLWFTGNEKKCLTLLVVGKLPNDTI